MPRQRVSRGFTLVELIVVLTLLLVLASLVLPAVQQARETARRTQCRAKLSQIGLALHNDQHAHGVLPPGCVNRTGPIRNQVEGYHFGWMTQILPMLQQTAVWNQFDFGRSVYDRGNSLAAMASLSEYFCPSYRFTKGKGESTYGGVHHDLEAPVDVDQNGVLFLNSAIRDEDIPDGLSHTAFVGECDVATHPLGYASGTQATLRNGGSPICKAPTSLAAVASLPVIQLLGDAEQPVVQSQPSLGARFNSFHPGGVQFVLGDGSVRFVNLSVDQQVYQSLLNRRDGGFGSEF
jgi:prepilin-type N-terminal cleavage/methylation domain-containing protein